MRDVFADTSTSKDVIPTKECVIRNKERLKLEMSRNYSLSAIQSLLGQNRGERMVGSGYGICAGKSPLPNSNFVYTVFGEDLFQLLWSNRQTNEV